MKREIKINSIFVNDYSTVLILKEQGPWKTDVFDANLERLQHRIYDYLEYALSGQMNRSFPETKGKNTLCIQLECSKIPSKDIEFLVSNMNSYIKSDCEIKQTLNENEFISEINIQSVVKK